MALHPAELRNELLRRVLDLPEARLGELERWLNDGEHGTGKAKFQSSVKPEHSQRKDWPHAPVHRVSEQGTYIVTAATLNKRQLFRGDEREILSNVVDRVS